MRITTEHLDKFEELVASGDSQMKAAKKLGVTVRGLKLAFEKSGRIMPTKIKPIDWTRLMDLVLQGYSQYKIAEILGTKQGYVSQVLAKEGLVTDARYHTDSVIAVTKELIEYIKENGGTINNAIEQTGLSINPITFRKYARALGFDWSIYKNAFKMYGKWMLLPCTPIPIYTADYKVQALCTGCNKEHTVLLTNLRSGASLGCYACCSGYLRPVTVKSESSEKTYRSMRAFAKAIGKNYATVRRTFSNEGCYVHEGIKYFAYH